MKIVNLATFLGLPAGTLFSKYEPCNFGPLLIKADTIRMQTEEAYGDFRFTQIADAIDCDDSGDFADKLFHALDNGTSLAMDFDTQSRDGEYEPDQMFAVWEQADVLALIARLSRATFDVVLPLSSGVAS